MRRDGLHFAAGELFLIIAPAHRGLPILDFGHRDAPVDRTHDRAEIAADAVFFTDFRDGLVRDATGAEAQAKFLGRFQVDALVRSVFAGDVTEVAADAFLVVDPGRHVASGGRAFPISAAWARSGR